jgi:hypothetical protein
VGARPAASAGPGSAALRGDAGVVLEYDGTAPCFRPHERASRSWIARRLAGLMGYRHGGSRTSTPVGGPAYIVPVEALHPAEAARLGVHCEADLFGGVVPQPFVATKSIAHPLVDDEAQAPPGWMPAFAQAVKNLVLRGFSAFSTADARRAALRLLVDGPVRLKPASAKGGLGQETVRAPHELDGVLARLDPLDLERYGMVVEEDMEEARTCSVGQVRVAGFVASYCGTQRTTRNCHGASAYGGSHLLVARGGYDALLGLDLSQEFREALAQARRFDEQVLASFTGLYKSRTNYDVLQGSTRRGASRGGVLEQSWRPGGASTAEVAALEAFHADPALAFVEASTFEVYGGCEPPPDARVVFDGMDETAGRLTKYCVVHEHGNPDRAIRDPGR